MKTVVAIGQMNSGENILANLEHCEELINKASQFEAKLLSLPENFAFLGSQDTASFKIAQSLDGEIITRLKNYAKKNSIWLSLGGFPEKILNNNKIYNSHIIIDNHGNIRAVYRKIHLFSLSLPDGPVFDESRLVSPGDKLVCLDAPFFNLGLSICYDLRFPYLFAAMRDQGAEVILIPAAFTSITGKAHWEILLRARAIETQCYVMAAAQNGYHNPRRSSYGHAMIIDPWGKIISQCDNSDSKDIAVAEIDLQMVRSLRKNMPIWKHRRMFSKSDIAVKS